MKKNLLLAVVATIFAYIPLEIIWRHALDRVPLTLHKELGRLQWLAQPSKTSVIPNNYIMIIGDSYAEGLGDWLMRVIDKGNPKFNAAHVLHDQTGRDVVTFGFRGGSPSWTAVFQAPAALHGIRLYRGMNLADPDSILVFFYAGNDVNDEMARLRFLMPPDFDHARADDRNYMYAYLSALGTHAENASAARWHPLRNAHLFDTATKLIKLLAKNWGHRRPSLDATDPLFRGGGQYREDWSRYEQSRITFVTRDGLKRYPAPTVEPFAFDTDRDIQIAGLWLQESLRVLKEKFPNSNVAVVYIPSPAGVYDLPDGTILMDRIRTPTSETRGPETHFSAADLEAADARVRTEIHRAAIEVDVDFIDTRPHLRRRAFDWGHLHGPNDAGHFNERGYTALAEAIEAGMRATSPRTAR
jgi:hypothetical protein